MRTENVCCKLGATTKILRIYILPIYVPPGAHRAHVPLCVACSCDPLVFLCVAIADKAFTAMQFVAVVLVSVAMALLMVAPFRPAKAGCGSVHALGLAGGILMAAFSFFQMLAFVLMIVIEKELDNGGCYRRAKNCLLSDSSFPDRLTRIPKHRLSFTSKRGWGLYVSIPDWEKTLRLRQRNSFWQCQCARNRRLRLEKRNDKIRPFSLGDQCRIHKSYGVTDLRRERNNGDKESFRSIISRFFEVSYVVRIARV